MLAVVWANEFATGLSDDPRFDDAFGPNEVYARALVNRAIDDWNKVVLDQNYDNNGIPGDNNLALTIQAVDLAVQENNPSARGATYIDDITTGLSEQAGWKAGVPRAATIYMDDDGVSSGWFFDATPTDDVEFTGIVGPYQANFVDATTVGQQHQNDFYRTIAHEIGHALGIALWPGLRIHNFLTPIDSNNDDTNEVDTSWFGGGLELKGFHHLNGSITSITPAGGGHIYAGGLSDAPQTPVHPNDLLNSGRTVPAGLPNPVPPIETTRQFISDLDVKILADAYGYSVVLPSTLNNAHVMHDVQTGALLVQGRPRIGTAGLFDTISITTEGANNETIKVVLNAGTANELTERVPTALVTQIIVAENGGSDSVFVAPSLTPLRKDVHYVVSSNQDALESSSSVGMGTVGDGVVDVSTIIPGAQTTLRAAIREANAAGTAGRGIYVGRGNYKLTLTGSAGDSQADFDITGNVTIIGAGAGASVVEAINPSTYRDRMFDVAASGVLKLSYITLAAGYAPNTSGQRNGGAVRVQAGGQLELGYSAIVGNETGRNGNGGGVYIAGGSTGSIKASVITVNAADNTGGGLYVDSGTGAVTLESTIIANNSDSAGTNPDIFVAAGRPFTSLGYNRFTSASGTWLQGSDYVMPSGNFLHYVVTSVVDRYGSANSRNLSLRDAIALANLHSGTPEIWLPAWKFVLTRQRISAANVPELNVSEGDIEIEKSMIIRGINGPGNVAATSVNWMAGVPTDKTLELVGDYDNDIENGIYRDVDGDDFLLWQLTFGTSNLSADGNDDGVVNNDDLNIWLQRVGNVLAIDSVVHA